MEIYRIKVLNMTGNGYIFHMVSRMKLFVTKILWEYTQMICFTTQRLKLSIKMIMCFEVSLVAV
jgi:hypothetical protein